MKTLQSDLKVKKVWTSTLQEKKFVRQGKKCVSTAATQINF